MTNAVQDSYPARQAVGFEGQKVDGQEYNAFTRICEEANGLRFGKPVARGTMDNTCLLLTAANVAKFDGITVRDVSVRPSAGDMYPRGGNVTVLDLGTIFVRVGEAVTPSDAPLYDTVADRFVKTANDNTVALPAGWRFNSSATNGGLAELKKR